MQVSALVINDLNLDISNSNSQEIASNLKINEVENYSSKNSTYRKFLAENNRQAQVFACESLSDQFNAGTLQQQIASKKINLNTLIHRAILEHNDEVLAFLMKHHVDVDYPDANGMSPLTIAILSQQSQIVKLLLQNGADVAPQKKWNDMSLLEISMKARDLESMRFLIEFGADIQGAFKSCRDPFQIYIEDFIKSGNWDLLNTALEFRKPSSSLLNEAFVRVACSYSPSCNQSSNAILLKLIQMGADVNADNGVVLLDACNNHHIQQYKAAKIERIKILLTNGANPNLFQTGQSSPLILMSGDILIMELLIKAGANPNQTWSSYEQGVLIERNSPLFAAIGNGDAASSLARVKLLIEAGADVNKKINQHTPLEYALAHGRMDVVNYLLFKADNA